MGGYLVVPTLHLHLHLHYLRYTLFSFDDGGFVLLVLLLVLLLLWSFLLGTIFKEKSSYNLAKKNSRKGDKIS